MNGSLILVYLNTKYKGNWDKIYKHIKDKKPCPKEDEINDYLSTKKINSSEWVSLLDEEYPEILKRVYRPPFVLNTNSEVYKWIQQIQFIFDSIGV